MALVVFDSKASSYDAEFSKSYVGNFQRNCIHRELRKILGGKSNLSILELNCGTGEDIAILQEYGTVLATDQSTEMLKIASQKNPDCKVEVVDLNFPLTLDGKFDFIFSNFGGFNCISPQRLHDLQKECASLLKPGGRLVVVMMHKWCFTEWMYFTLRLNFKKSFRRLRGKSEFLQLPIFYYTMAATRNIFRSFKLEGIMPTGILLAGEYMNKPGRKLKMKDESLKWAFPILGADHILYNFIKI